MARASGPRRPSPWGKLALVVSINAVAMLALAALVFVFRPIGGPGGNGVDMVVAEVLMLAGVVEIGLALWFFRKASDQ